MHQHKKRSVSKTIESIRSNIGDNNLGRNRRKYFRGYFHIKVVKIKKKILPLWKPEI